MDDLSDTVPGTDTDAGAATDTIPETGTLTAYTGPMYAGKTTALIDALQDYDSYAAFKPALDDRYDNTQIVTHDDTACEAYVVDTATDIESLLTAQSMVGDRPDAVGIDEAQFFDTALPGTVETLLERGYDVVVAGLDKDFCRDGFDPVPALVEHANQGAFLYADCAADNCGDPARYTQRLIDGEPAEHDSPQVLVGGTDTYEPRCEIHHVVRYRR